ncbi:MAG: efflux RND transporter periplasmic adaptor subunit [Pseudomonadota bacterium]
MATLSRTKSFLGRLVRFTVRITLTLAVMGGAGAAVFYGQEFLEARADARPAPEPAPLVSVAVRPLTPEAGYSQVRAFVGQIEPRKTVAVSFELPGTLTQITVDEGQSVTKGQLIATQDVELLTAERDQLRSSRAAVQAQLDFALQQLERSAALRDRGFASQQALDQATSTRNELDARIRELDAGLARIAIQLDKSRITAPFDGRVTRRFLDGGEAVSPGQAVLEIVESAAPMVRVGVPVSFGQDTLSTATLMIAGQEFEARFVTLRPDIDPTTRTRTALFAPVGPIPAAFGQTAEIRVDTKVAVQGTWVPIESLKEGERGQWTLLVLSEDNVVRRATALVVHAETDRVFVQGSFPPGTRMIEEGPQRVVPGQQVIPLQQMAEG